MNLNGKHIVTVDDDIEFSKSIKTFLEDLDITVNHFSDGYLAIDFLKTNNSVDLLIVDLRMPKLDGLEILKYIRELGLTLPVIVISATDEVQTAIQAVKSGASDFLSKPIFDLAELEMCISKTLQQDADKKELEKYRSGLEELVKQKTEELTKTNEELNQQIERTTIAEKKAKLGSQKYIDAVEEATKQMSKELHDSIGQKLTLIKINLDVLSKTLPDGNNNLEIARKSVEQIGEDLSYLVRKLYPQSIEKYSLLKNLESLIKDFRESKNLDINFNCIGCDKELNRDLKLDIYRIFQESLNNIIKHSMADRVDLSLAIENKLIKISIADNGSGIDFSTIETKRGAGLFTMQERVEKYNGSFIISSNIGKGTTIFVEIKL